MTIAYTPPLFTFTVLVIALFVAVTLTVKAIYILIYLRNRWLNAYWLYHSTKINCFHNVQLNSNIEAPDKKMLRDNFRLKMPSPYTLFTLNKPFTLVDYFTAKEVAFFTDPGTRWDLPKRKQATINGSAKFNTPAAEHLAQINKPLSFLDRKPKIVETSNYTVKYPACNLPLKTLAI